MYKNRTLNTYSYWSLLVEQGWSSEARALMRDTSGFHSEYNQQVNAGDVFQTFIGDGTSGTYYTLKYGFDSMAKKIISINYE